MPAKIVTAVNDQNERLDRILARIEELSDLVSLIAEKLGVGLTAEDEPTEDEPAALDVPAEPAPAAKTAGK